MEVPLSKFTIEDAANWAAVLTFVATVIYMIWRRRVWILRHMRTWWLHIRTQLRQVELLKQ
jgi:hypothetical protein